MKTKNILQQILVPLSGLRGLLCGLLLLSACGNNANKKPATDAAISNAEIVTENTAKGPYKIKSGYMENKMQGMNITQRIWFDDYGAKQYMQTLMGDEVDEHTSYSVIRDSYMYSFKNDTTAGTRMRTGITSSGMDYDHMSAEDIERYGVKKVGKATLLGKACDEYVMEKYGMSVWIWKGISFKTIMKSGNMKMTTETLVFREEPVDASLFELPKGKEFKAQ